MRIFILDLDHFSNLVYSKTSQTSVFVQWVCKQKGNLSSLNWPQHQCRPPILCNSTRSNMGTWFFFPYFCILTFSLFLFLCILSVPYKNHIMNFFPERAFFLLTYLRWDTTKAYICSMISKYRRKTIQT